MKTCIWVFCWQMCATEILIFLTAVIRAMKTHQVRRFSACLPLVTPLTFHAVRCQTNHCFKCKTQTSKREMSIKGTRLSIENINNVTVFSIWGLWICLFIWASFFFHFWAVLSVFIYMILLYPWYYTASFYKHHWCTGKVWIIPLGEDWCSGFFLS